VGTVAAVPARPDRPDHPTAAPFVPAGADLAGLAAAARGCRGCGLHALDNTGTVFGEGRPDARVVLVGEQPGDVEDRRLRPFVGPAGKLLDRALADAGIDRDTAYVTNAVKHFKFTQSAPGKRRIHAKPDAYEVAACKPWLVAELNLLRPKVVVLLGATAAQALLGPSFRVTRSRGTLLAGPPGSAAQLVATIHPSAVLRTDPAQRDAAYDGLVADLRVAAGGLAADGQGASRSTSQPPAGSRR
jgi:uracil-DNA glycosylase family protein